MGEVGLCGVEQWNVLPDGDLAKEDSARNKMPREMKKTLSKLAGVAAFACLPACR